MQEPTDQPWGITGLRACVILLMIRIQELR